MMSDFLGNLAARHLNLAAVIKPRLLSLFEPPMGTGPVEGVAIVEAAGRESRYGSESDLPVTELPPPSLRSTLEAPQPGPATEVKRSVEPIAVQPPPLSITRLPTEAEPIRSREPPRQVAIAPTPLVVAAQHTINEGSASPGEAPPVNSRAVLTPAPAPGPLLAPKNVAAPRVTPTVKPAAVPEPAPTIRVTIGRIEVRAIVQSTPPAPRAAPPAPKLSLGEYLRLRNEEKA